MFALRNINSPAQSCTVASPSSTWGRVLTRKRGLRSASDRSPTSRSRSILMALRSRSMRSRLCWPARAVSALGRALLLRILNDKVFQMLTKVFDGWSRLSTHRQRPCLQCVRSRTPRPDLAQPPHGRVSGCLECRPAAQATEAPMSTPARLEGIVGASASAPPSVGAAPRPCRRVIRLKSAGARLMGRLGLVELAGGSGRHWQGMTGRTYSGKLDLRPRDIIP